MADNGAVGALRLSEMLRWKSFTVGANAPGKPPSKHKRQSATGE